MSEIKVINSLEELDTAIDNNPNLIVQFSATWCGPCKMVSLHINDTQEKLKDKVTIVKVDISNNPEIAEKYGVRSIPAFAYIKDKSIIQQITGVQTQKQMIDKVNQLF